MRISVFGLGYVGCVSAACLAANGHFVVGVDVNPYKVAEVQAGRSPISEPGLNDLLASGAASGRLRATLDAHGAVQETDISLICVGTPTASRGGHNGSVDLQYIERVCQEIGASLAAKESRHIVVVRSTVLPGTVLGALAPILEAASGRTAGPGFGLCMNPEFLREGVAIRDYAHPGCTVIGELDAQSGDPVACLYEDIDAPLVRTSIPVAEMAKYVSNAYHALKITFANEIGALCQNEGIDGQEVMEIFCRDERLNISPAYLKPGFAFGGSCLPKDVRALVHRAKERDLDAPLLSAILPSNRLQLERAIQMVENAAETAEGRRRIGVLGLSFKPATDDVRESPTIALVETLVGRGYQVAVYDEIVDPQKLIGVNRAFLERALPHVASLIRGSLAEVIDESEVVVIANASPSFRQAPLLLREDQVLIDLVGAARVPGARGPARIGAVVAGGGRYEGIGW